MKTFSVLEAYTKAISQALILCSLLIVFCHSAKGLDTISSIRGTRPKPHAKAMHRLHTVSHFTALRKVAAHHISRPVLWHRVVVYSTTKSKSKPTVSESQLDTDRNLIVNGDFEGGNQEFISEYSYSPGDVWGGSTYDVVTDPHKSHPLAGSISDHTSGSGLMMVVNGAQDSNRVVWQENIPITPKIYYVLTAWAMNWGSLSSKPECAINLQFSINGLPVGALYTSRVQAGLWEHTSTVWYSGSSKNALISITDVTTNVTIGNTFALDDISFMTLPKAALADRHVAVKTASLVPNQSKPISSFVDNFQDPNESSGNWIVNENGGSVRFQKGAISLKDDPPGFDLGLQMQGRHYDQSGFPLVKLRQNPFPLTGNWTLRFSLAFNKAGCFNPDGVSILRSDGGSLLVIGQDNTGEYAFLNGKGVWRAGENSSTHRIVLTKQTNQVMLSIDGTFIGTDIIGLPPTNVQLGGSLKHGSQGWNNFDLQSISVVPE